MSQTVTPLQRTKTSTHAAEVLTPHSLLQNLPVFRDLAAKIGVHELRRRLVHISPVVLPFMLWGIPHADPWGPILINFSVAMSVTLVAVILWRFGAIARTETEDGISAVVGYAMPILMTVLLLPARAELAMMTLGIVAIGDGAATLGGLWFGGRKLPWNLRKTFAGLFCFITLGTLVATVIYWGEARPGVSWQMAFVCASLATVAAGLVESLPLAWNDNFRVGVTAALVGTLVQIFVLGR